MLLVFKFSGAPRGTCLRPASLWTRFEKRRRLTWSYATQPWRRDYDRRVSALFGRGGKGKRVIPAPEEIEEVEDVVQEVTEVDKTPQQQFHESVAPDPPFWRTALHPRNLAPWTFGSVIGGLALYVIYLAFIKDRTDDIEKIEFDLNTVVTQLARLKELRMEPDMTDTDAIRVRSFLLSLVIKQKRQDPVKVVNSALTLLGERHLTATEKRVLLGVEETKVPEMSVGPVSDLTGLKMIDAAISEAQMQYSAAYGPDASVLWWHKLSYICVLQMKKSGALFMTPAPHKGSDAFALVGFEDPEEAFHAGKMPIQQQLWGILSAMRDRGAGPCRPLEDEKYFDLTWLQPREFNALMERAGCHGVVIPAGTLRSNQTGRPIPIPQIRPAIDRVSPQLKGKSFERCVDLDPEEQDLESLRPDESEEFGSLMESTSLNGLYTTLEELPFTQRGPGDGPEIPAEAMNGFSTVSANQEPTVAPKEAVNGFHSNGVSNELLKRHVDQPSSSTDTPSATEAVNGSTPVINGSSQSSPAEPWWMELASVVVPKIKTENDDGGNVEINISMDPEVTDFRAVLFEDEREAKGFLGILGRLYGPSTLVATKTQPPREFLEQHQKLDPSKIVVLCTGALLLDRDDDRDRLRNAVRLAHVATEIKKGVPYPPTHGDDAIFEKKAIKVAETVVSNFKDRMDHNTQTHSHKGDADYRDPLEGFIHDLKEGGLDDLFGTPEDGEGMSAEVGESEVKSLFHPFNTQQDPTDDTLYTQFVAQMNRNLDQAQDQIQNGSSLTEGSSEADLLDASLDDLVRDVERDEALTREDEFEVVYPEATGNVESHRSGPHWFAGLAVIYLPQYLTTDGRASYLAMTDSDLGQRLIIGFQDQSEAIVCKEMMKAWADRSYSAAGVAAVPPQVLLEFCEENQAQAVIIRRSTIGLSLGMSQAEFLNRVAIIATTQSTQYPVFNG